MTHHAENRCQTVARWFGLAWPAQLRRQPRPSSLDSLLPAPGQIVLLAGPSGSGKSALLRRLRRRLPCIDLNRIRLPRRPVIELFQSMPLEDALALLSRLGLAEAQTYLLQPRQLSTGQRWRLRLALALAEAQRREHRGCLVCDEFAAPLDRITALVISHALRRIIDRTPNLSAIIATTRDDLRHALRPDITIDCDFGEMRIHHNDPTPHVGCASAHHNRKTSLCQRHSRFQHEVTKARRATCDSSAVLRINPLSNRSTK